MTTITKKYTFEYAHIVRGAYSERCRYNIHGHSGIVEITISAEELDDAGMVLDFGYMQKIKALVDMFDHATLLWGGESCKFVQFFEDNFRRIILMDLNTTAENIAATIMHYATTLLPTNRIKVESVTVHETATGRATCYHYNKDATILSVHDQKDCDAELLTQMGLWETK